MTRLTVVVLVSTVIGSSRKLLSIPAVKRCRLSSNIALTLNGNDKLVSDNYRLTVSVDLSSAEARRQGLLSVTVSVVLFLHVVRQLLLLIAHLKWTKLSLLWSNYRQISKC